MSDSQMAAVLGASLAVGGFIGIVYYVLMAIAQWKIFTKAGEAGWKGIIPFLNSYTMFKISWETKFFWIMLALSVVYSVLNSVGNEFTTVLALVAWVGLMIVSIVQMVKLSKSFGRGNGFAVGLVFLPVIFMLILAFGDSQYVGKDNN